MDGEIDRILFEDESMIFEITKPSSHALGFLKVKQRVAHPDRREDTVECQATRVPLDYDTGQQVLCERR